VLLTTPESLEAMLVSSTRSTPLQGTTGDGTCWPYSNDCSGSLDGRYNASGFPRRWATRSSCSPGCRAQEADTAPAQVVAPHLREKSPALPPPGDIQVDYVGSLENAATVIAAQ
jgi:hypothetical protein